MSHRLWSEQGPWSAVRVDHWTGNLQKYPKLLAKIGWHGAILAAVLTAAWHFIDFHEFARSLTSVHWPWVALVMGLSTLDRFLMAGKWLQLLRHVGSSATFGALLGAYYQVAFLERLIPSSLSGDALRGTLICKRFQGTNGVLATMVVEKLVAMLAAIVLALFGLGLLLTQRYGLGQWWLFALVPALLIAAVAGLTLSLHRPLAAWFIRLLPKRVQPVLTGIYGHYSSFRTVPRILGWHFFYCIVEQVVQVLMWLGAALAIGVETPVVVLFAALSVAQCVRKFAMLLDGWLLGEFSVVAIASLFGVPQTQAFTFSILAHACVVVASLPGAFLFGSSAIRLAELRRAQPASTVRRDALPFLIGTSAPRPQEFYAPAPRKRR
jgi:glycosyltransferase 2 family protein